VNLEVLKSIRETLNSQRVKARYVLFNNRQLIEDFGLTQHEIDGYKSLYSEINKGICGDVTCFPLDKLEKMGMSS
tara:strand:+ start:369 stop:593 length:225 start_codon:yes stop_codon:yes gene_type:complete